MGAAAMRLDPYACVCANGATVWPPTSASGVLTCACPVCTDYYQSEYVSLLLVNSNCLLLLLKILNLNMSTYVAACNRVPGSELFEYCTQRGAADAVAEGPYVCWRNLHAVVNMLRVLQKLTKGKRTRIMVLVHYKAPAILKRLLKIECSMLQLYALKLLKSQLRFLGRKWRTSNMRIMSAIYHRVRNGISDDWAYAAEPEAEPSEADERSAREPVELFHARHYADILGPVAALAAPQAAGGNADAGAPVDPAVLPDDVLALLRDEHVRTAWLEHYALSSFAPDDA